MFSSLTVKPLLIAVAILSVTAAGLGWHVANLYERIGAAKAECEVTRLEDSSTRSTVTRDLEAESLRNQVTILEGELTSLRDKAKFIEQRHSENSLLLGEFRNQLNAARKADPTLDEPVDTTRLRALETAYRVRAKGRDRHEVPSNP